MRILLLALLALPLTVPAQTGPGELTGARPSARSAARPSVAAPARRPAAARTPADPDVSAFLNETVDVATLRADELPDLYGHFIDRVRDERRQWQAADWNRAAAVLARLNGRYEEVRKEISLDDRLRIRSWQGEFYTLKAAKR